MSEWSEYFLRSRSSVVQLELLEIAHPAFSRTFRVVRNKADGVTVTLEDGSQATFEYYPLRITSIGARENLDYGIRVDLGDLGALVPAEVERVLAAGATAMRVKPTLLYRTYRSDVLTEPLFGPVTLQIGPIVMKREGASFEARAPALNVNTTGELYVPVTFPSLRGFLP